MHWLTHFKHKVVCKIGKVVDCSHTAVEKSDSHIYRADFSCDIFKSDTGIALAELVFNLYVNLWKIVVN